jgi:hypothetical protein
MKYEALYQRNITGRRNTPYGTNSICNGRSCSFLSSAVIAGVQRGEMSKLA